MSIGKYGLVLLSAAVIFNDSHAQSSSSAPHPPARATSAAMTIAIPAHQDVATKVTLPAGTFKVRMTSGAGAFTCINLQFVTLKGRNAKDEYFEAAAAFDIPAHLDSTQTHNAPGDPYVIVVIHCHGGAADSQLAFAAVP